MIKLKINTSYTYRSSWGWCSMMRLCIERSRIAGGSAPYTVSWHLTSLIVGRIVGVMGSSCSVLWSWLLWVCWCRAMAGSRATRIGCCRVGTIWIRWSLRIRWIGRRVRWSCSRIGWRGGGIGRRGGGIRWACRRIWWAWRLVHSRIGWGCWRWIGRAAYRSRGGIRRLLKRSRYWISSGIRGCLRRITWILWCKASRCLRCSSPRIHGVRQRSGLIHRSWGWIRNRLPCTLYRNIS